MSYYPQIRLGTVAQFPLKRTRRWHSITNVLEGGQQIILQDAAGGHVEWDLTYTDLSVTESQSLNGLFAGTQGSFGAFTFIDPLVNLLGWTEDLTRSDWQSGLLSKTSGISDPLGGQSAWSLSNTSQGSQQLTQTLAVPGDYVSCYSAFVRADGSGLVTIQRDGMQTICVAAANWMRVYVSGTGSLGSAESSFSILISPGETIEVWGLQVEVQPFPSMYKPSEIASGIYEETYFANDELTFSQTAPGMASTKIKLISRV